MLTKNNWKLHPDSSELISGSIQSVKPVIETMCSKKEHF